MVAFTKIADFVEHLGLGVHNLSTGSLRIALSNTAPAAEASNPTTAGNGVLANVTQISYTNYSDDLTVDRTLDGVAWVLATATATLDANDFTITASGGAIATFRYVYLYNDTPTSPADPLIGLWDAGSAIDLASGESLTIDFGADAGTDGDILTLT